MPQQIWKVQKPLKAGSRAAPIPEGAPIGFRTASAFVQESGLGDMGNDGHGFDLVERDVQEKENLGRVRNKKQRAEIQKTALAGKTLEVHELAPIETIENTDKSKPQPLMKLTEASNPPNSMSAKGPTSRKSKKVAGQNAGGSNNTEPARATAQIFEDESLGDAVASLNKLKKVRKTRQPKSNQDGVLNGRVSKVAPTPKLRIKTFRRPGDQNCQQTKSDESRNSEVEPSAATNTDPVLETTTNLPPVMTRRRGWTPPIDTVSLHDESPLNGAEVDAVNKRPKLDNVEHEITKPVFNFGDLQSCFAYKEVQSSARIASASTRENGGESLAKRQRVEVCLSDSDINIMIDTNLIYLQAPDPIFRLPAPPAKPSKAKSPKKPTTVTAAAIAMAQTEHVVEILEDEVQHDDIPCERRPQKSITLTTTSKGTNVKLNDVDEKKPKKKRKASTKSAKKQAEPLLPLPSPKSAINRIVRQDVMFGTSSQMLRDDDPDFIRDIQSALNASEIESGRPTFKTVPSDISTRLARIVKAHEVNRNLWAAGARGEEDITLSPEDPEERRRQRLLEEQATARVQKNKEDFVDIDHLNKLKADSVEADHRKPSTAKSEVIRTTTETVEVEETAKDELPPRRKAAPKPQDPLSRPIGGLRLASFSKHKPTLCFLRSRSDSPDKLIMLPSFSTNQPSALRQLTTAAHSATKISKAVTTKCTGTTPEPSDGDHSRSTESNHKTQSESKSEKAKSKTTKRIAPAKDPNAPKRPRGRPRKDQVEEPDTESASVPKKSKTVTKKKQVVPDEEGYVAIDDIEDDAPPSPSPSRRATPTKLAELEMSTETAEESKSKPAKRTKKTKEEKDREKMAKLYDPATLDAQKKLFAAITKAVKSQSPSKDQKSPSWWERIMMYDPIILEVFTEWLNERGVRLPEALVTASSKKATGADLLTPLVVQKWCEEKSVCCIWEQGLWDKRRKRKAGADGD